MMHVRKKIKMFSVNQMCVYHTLLETYNIIRNSASEQIKMKWTDISEKNYFMRNLNGFGAIMKRLNHDNT